MATSGSIKTKPFEFEVAVSDETSALTTGVTKVKFPFTVAGTITDVFIALSGQSTAGVVTADLNKAGVSIFSTNPSIDANEDTSLSGTQAVIATAAVAKGDMFTVDIDAAGTGAKGLKMVICGIRAS